MKKALKYILIFIMLSCDESEPTKSDYWGCWREINNTEGYYDIILTEGDPHRFELAIDCIPVTGLRMDVGLFRNDTLILDNGIAEYWCYLHRDTLHFSSGNHEIIKLLKVE
jgi:hypothetical protein